MAKLEARIEQCDKDIEALNKERNKLLAEKKKQDDPLYEIRRYIAECPIKYEFGKKVIICGNYVTVPLPNCNDTWTFAAFDWVKAFCKEFDSVGHSVYPVHYDSLDNANYLYIKI